MACEPRAVSFQSPFEAFAAYSVCSPDPLNTGLVFCLEVRARPSSHLPYEHQECGAEICGSAHAAKSESQEGQTPIAHFQVCAVGTSLLPLSLPQPSLALSGIGGARTPGPLPGRSPVSPATRNHISTCLGSCLIQVKGPPLRGHGHVPSMDQPSLDFSSWNSHRTL